MPMPEAPRRSSPVCLRLGAAAVAALIAVIGPAAGRACAQGVAVVQGAPVILSQQDLDFATLFSATDRLTYKTNQVRRFRNEQGRLVGVREQVVVTGNGTRHPPFRLTFLGMEGAPPPPEEATRWTDLYRRYASLFHEHGGFRIYDVARATQNYIIC